jgi:hypothetical protein
MDNLGDDCPAYLRKAIVTSLIGQANQRLGAGSRPDAKDWMCLLSQTLSKKTFMLGSLWLVVATGRPQWTSSFLRPPSTLDISLYVSL